MRQRARIWHAAIYVLLSVVNYFVSVIRRESLVGHERIGIDRAASSDVLSDFALQRLLAAGRNHRSADLSAALQDSEDWSLVFASGCSNAAMVFIAVHVPSRATDERLIRFDFAPAPAEFQKRVGLHGETNPVQHEPRGFLSDAQGAPDFVGADSVLAIGNHPNGDKPLVERKRRILKDSPDFDRELFAEMLAFAFPHPPSRDKADFFASAGGAFNPVRPSPSDHEVEAVVGIGEVNDGLLAKSWAFSWRSSQVEL